MVPLLKLMLLIIVCTTKRPFRLKLATELIILFPTILILSAVNWTW